MRQSLTAVLERNTTFTGDFQTEPYEVAWAGEARWFVHVLSASTDDAEVRFVTQISPDGLNWCDLDGIEHVATGTGVISWSAANFGHWLRVRATLHGEDVSVKARIYLTVKS